MGKKIHRVFVRLGESDYRVIQDLAELSGTSKSEVVRYAIHFTRVLHDPELRFRDVVKEHVIKIIKENADLALDMPFIDVVKPVRELAKLIGVDLDC